MDKRDYKRITIGFKADIMRKDNTYECIIDNLSENGALITTDATEDELDLRPGEMIEIKFQPAASEILILQCRIKWIDKVSPKGLSRRIGVEIITPPWNKSRIFV